MSHEVTICTLIKDKMVSENKWQAEKLIKFATMLRIPRYHFDYIEKYGVNEFVDYCEEVVRRERNMQEQKKVNEKRVELRQQYSILKTNRSKLEGMDQHKLNMIDI
jgi:ERCC4-related helicase